VDETTITPALDELRGLVQADGADMTLTGVDGTTVNLRLVVETASCVECVMPRELLEQIALNIFQRNGAGADAVVIDDPREHPDFVMPGH
jgi:NifU-like domain